MAYNGETPISYNGKEVIAFLQSGEFQIPSGVTNVEVLIVGGGGPGGGSLGGGGGAGGLIHNTNYDISGQTSPITVTVGDGGVADSGTGTKGGDSVFAGLTALGGGAGFAGDEGTNPPARCDGGNGGGGSRYGGNGTVGNPGGDALDPAQGNDGGEGAHSGDTSNSTREGGGGGGGYGEVGGNAATGSIAGIGGDGLYVDSFGAIYEGWFAGGGGGCAHTSDTGGGDGGKGGGGGGGITGTIPEGPGDGGIGYNNGQNGSITTGGAGGTNTGGGGGGGGWNSGLGGDGGSGIVLVAYEQKSASGTVSISGTATQGAIVRSIDQTNNTYVDQDTTDASGNYNVTISGSDAHIMVEYESGGTYYHAQSQAYNDGTVDQTNIDFSLETFTPKSGSVTFQVTVPEPLVGNLTLSNQDYNKFDASADLADQGDSSVTERGFVYNTSGTPTTADNKVIVSGTANGTYSDTITGLNELTQYYVRGYAINSDGTGYSNTETITTTEEEAPTVDTMAVSNETFKSIDASANVSAAGDSAVSERGFVYNTSGNPTTGDTKIVVGSGTGAFNTTLDNLNASQTYYIKAYAINNAGESYSSQVSTSTKDLSVSTDSSENVGPYWATLKSSISEVNP